MKKVNSLMISKSGNEIIDQMKLNEQMQQLQISRDYYVCFLNLNIIRIKTIG